MPLRGQKGDAARTRASPSQIAREIRPSATIGTATNSLANVSKLGHLAAHCAFRQLALNEVKSRLPGANQARNHEAVVSRRNPRKHPRKRCAETPWPTLSNRLRHCASPAHSGCLGLSPPHRQRDPALWRALLAVGHVPVADALLDGDRRAGVLDADALSSLFLFIANAVEFLIDEARREKH